MYQYVSITLLNKQFAIENGPVEIVDLPIKEGVSFHFPQLFVCLPEGISECIDAAEQTSTNLTSLIIANLR